MKKILFTSSLLFFYLSVVSILMANPISVDSNNYTIAQKKISEFPDGDLFESNDDEDDEDSKTIGTEDEGNEIKKNDKPKKEAKVEKKSTPKKEEPKEEVIEVKDEPKSKSTKTSTNKPKGFTVQLGIFTAEASTKKFKSLEKEFSAKLFVYKNADGQFIAQIGDFEKKEDASELSQNIKAKNISCFVSIKK